MCNMDTSCNVIIVEEQFNIYNPNRRLFEECGGAVPLEKKGGPWNQNALSRICPCYLLLAG